MYLQHAESDAVITGGPPIRPPDSGPCFDPVRPDNVELYLRDYSGDDRHVANSVNSFFQIVLGDVVGPPSGSVLEWDPSRSY